MVEHCQLRPFASVSVMSITETYTLSLHDALPIFLGKHDEGGGEEGGLSKSDLAAVSDVLAGFRSEEHTSELQSHSDLVCRLLLEKKNTFSTNSRSFMTSWLCCWLVRTEAVRSYNS